MTDTPTESFDADLVRWVGLAVLVAQRDGTTVDEASANLSNLMNTPEVIAAHQATLDAEAAERDRIAALETGKATAEEQLGKAVSQVEAVLASLRALFPAAGAPNP